MTFTERYNKLNTKQKEAVDAIYGPVLVIAGPGSGKTELLSARIANILATTDYLPSNILCLTFTDNAAKNMRARLAAMIGQDAYRVAIHTFHSFGSEVLNRFRYLSKEYSDARPVDTIESSSIFDAILEALPWDSPYKPGYRASDTIREVRGTIDTLKKGGITPTSYRVILELNKRAIERINPLIEQYWSSIDALGQKKEDKEKKRVIFEEFTDMVRQLSVLEQYIGSYDRYEVLFQRSLDAAWEAYGGDGSTKFMNAWRDTWTERSYTGKRELKETGKMEKQEALAGVFESYQQILAERGLIDFSDMILEAIGLIEGHDIVRMSLAEQYQFIMIDEFQDTNEAQMRLIHGILSVDTEKPNIFAVGDDDQSIYKFQGANTKNIRDFHDRYADTRLIMLEENYRSKAEIIEGSRAVIVSESNDIANIFPGATKQFEAVRGTGGAVRKYRFQNELEEISWIVTDIEEKIRVGVAPDEIAIITKKNKTLELIAKGLLEKEISVKLSKDESIFDSEEIILLINILKLLNSLDMSYREENSQLLVTILSHPCFAIDRLTLWNLSKTIYHARKETTRSWIENLARHGEERLRDTANFFRELTQRSRTERLEDIIDLITGAHGLSLPDDYDEDGKTDPLQIDIFSGDRKDYISPFYTYYFGQLSNDKGANILYARHLANVRAFIERVRGYKNSRGFLTLSDAIELLSLIEKYALDIEVSHIIGDANSSIELITVYKAKGLEWSHVYVPCVTQSEYRMGKFGGSPLPKNLPLEAEKDDDADIERLIYTAYTRAKDSLTVSYSSENMAEKSLEPLACIGVEQEGWEDITSVPLSSLTATLELEKNELFALPYLGEETEFLRDRIEKIFVMNATALQSFLNVADAGPEYFVANTLLRFPQAKNIASSYGSAIHAALEDFFTDYTSKGAFMKSLLFESFEKNLKMGGFDRVTESTYLARGQANLESLYSEITGQSYGELSLEYDFRAAHGGVYLPKAPLGRGDPAEREGGSASEVSVILSEAKDPANGNLDSTHTQNDDTKNQEPRTKNPGAIQLTGKIDRIEKRADDSLVITDYKTGGGFDMFDGKGAEYMKIKQWKYRLQLCFYSVLFELSPRWRMYEKRQYELFFVEKNHDEDRFQRLIEYIQPGEIERTKRLIIAVMSKIQNLDFPDISKYPKTLEGIRMFEEDLLEGRI